MSYVSQQYRIHLVCNIPTAASDMVTNLLFRLIRLLSGACGGAVSRGTALTEGKFWVRILINSLEFSLIFMTTALCL